MHATLASARMRPAVKGCSHPAPSPPPCPPGPPACLQQLHRHLHLGEPRVCGGGEGGATLSWLWWQAWVGWAGKRGNQRENAHRRDGSQQGLLDSPPPPSPPPHRPVIPCGWWLPVVGHPGRVQGFHDARTDRGRDGQGAALSGPRQGGQHQPPHHQLKGGLCGRPPHT